MAKKLQVTGRGKAVYPHLNTPDTKFKEEGEYHVKLEMTEAEGKSLAEQIDAAMLESLAEAKEAEKDPKKLKKIKQADNPPYEYDEEAGTYTFSFKMKASGISKKTNKPWSRACPLFDAKMNKLPENAIVGGGSTIKVSFELTKFFTALVGAGVSLRLEGVQVLALVAPSRDAKAMGFESEDGYEAEAASEETPAKKAFAEASKTESSTESEASDENDDDDDF